MTWKLMAFVATARADDSRTFYRDVLGLSLVHEDDFALVLDSNGITLRVAKVPEVHPAQNTVLGWLVDDLAKAVAGLRDRGVAFERFDGMELGDLGIWIAPGGAAVAWFRDPDGNLLSLTQPPA